MTVAQPFLILDASHNRNRERKQAFSHGLRSRSKNGAKSLRLGSLRYSGGGGGGVKFHQAFSKSKFSVCCS